MLSWHRDWTSGGETGSSIKGSTACGDVWNWLASSALSISWATAVLHELRAADFLAAAVDDAQETWYASQRCLASWAGNWQEGSSHDRSPAPLREK